MHESHVADAPLSPVYCPASQFSHGVEAWLSASKVPSVQSMQEVAAVGAYCPLSHAVQLVCAALAVCFPASQGSHSGRRNSNFTTLVRAELY